MLGSGAIAIDPAVYQGRVYSSKVDSPPTIIILAVAAAQRVTYAYTYACTRARTCAISVASSRHLRAGSFRTMRGRCPKRKTRTALRRKYMGRSARMRFREERRREGEGASKQESYE